MGNIQNSEAKRLQEMWGKKPCNHPSWHKEYMLGSSTGDYVCSQCGLTVWENDPRKTGENKK